MNSEERELDTPSSEESNINSGYESAESNRLVTVPMLHKTWWGSTNLLIKDFYDVLNDLRYHKKAPIGPSLLRYTNTRTGKFYLVESRYRTVIYIGKIIFVNQECVGTEPAFFWNN